MGHQTSLAAAIIVFAAWSPPSYSQAPRSGGGEAQKFMEQYQQISAAKIALQTQVAQMKKDLDAAHADLAAMTKERDMLKSRGGGSAAQLAQLKSAKETAEKNLDQYKQRMTELVARFRDTANNLKDVEADRTQMRKTVEERNKAFDTCADDNLKLFDINREILDRYEHVGVFTKVSSAEPFTRITRTRIENLADQYRARALELKVKAPKSP